MELVSVCGVSQGLSYFRLLAMYESYRQLSINKSITLCKEPCTECPRNVSVQDKQPKDEAPCFVADARKTGKDIVKKECNKPNEEKHKGCNEQ